MQRSCPTAIDVSERDRATPVGGAVTGSAVAVARNAARSVASGTLGREGARSVSGRTLGREGARPIEV
jgi:hypothetical protein